MPDLELAPLVKRLFILYAEGPRSIKELAKQIGHEVLNLPTRFYASRFIAP